MLKGFKEFILRGNVVDLAIAVVIGTAFAAVVSAFVSKIITPIINSIPGGSSQGFQWPRYAACNQHGACKRRDQRECQDEH